MAWVEKRGKKYRVYWDVGTPEERERRVASFDSSDEADQFKKKIEYELSVGTYVDISKMSFGEYLDHWIRLHGENLAPKTLESYKCEIKNHIKPHLGNIKLAKLSPLHLQDYYSIMRKEGKAEVLQALIKATQHQFDTATNKKASPQELKRISNNLKRAEARLKKMKEEEAGGLSNTSVNYHHRIIHKALRQAVRWQMVSRNVADAVEPPEKDDTDIRYLKRHELNRFLKVIKSSEFYAIYMTGILTGMRQGEILGMRWQDVDFDTGIIKVRQQLQYAKEKGGYFFKPPKKKSIRDIPMPLPLNKVFRDVKKDQFKLKGIFEDTYKDNDLVFCAPSGRPLSRSRVSRDLKTKLEENGLEHIRFHALRHTFATMARAAGVPMEDIQDMLGHADISTTKNMYTHVELEPLRKSMDKMTEYLGI